MIYILIYFYGWKNIRKLNNNELFFKIDENDRDNKLNYIIKFIVDSNYYYLKYNFKKKRNEVTIENEFGINISEEEDHDIFYEKENRNIQEINNYELNKNNNSDFLLKILNKSSFIIKNDKNGKMTINIFNEKIKEKVKNITNRESDKNNINILINNFKKLLEFLHNVREIIENEYKNKCNLIIKLNLIQEEENNNNPNSIYNIKCKYIFYPINEERLVSFQDYNILEYGLDGLNQGLFYLINEINDDNYKEIDFNESLDIWELIKQKDENEKKIISQKEKEEKKYSLLNIIESRQVSYYKIIEFEKVISTHKGSVEFIYNLSNGYFITGGDSSKLFIYDQQFNPIFKINLPSNPFGVYEVQYHENKTTLKIISFSYENIYIIKLDIQKCLIYIQKFEISANNVVQINFNTYIINNVKGGFISQDSFEKNSLKKIFTNSYKQGIKIREKIIAFTSNNIMPNGKDRIIFYNVKYNEIIYELEGYSFCMSKNSLLLMNNYKTFNDKILICACKKYTSYQKNGILLIYINDDFSDFDENFYETGYFEPSCLSNISLVNNFYINKKLDKIIDTDYFFIGGFDPIKGEGVIKLYKIIVNYDPSKIKIEFCQDIIFEDEEKKFYGFNGAITSMVQSKATGQFLISCSDGNINLFSPANINYFLLNE